MQLSHSREVSLALPVILLSLLLCPLWSVPLLIGLSDAGRQDSNAVSTYNIINFIADMLNKPRAKQCLLGRDSGEYESWAHCFGIEVYGVNSLDPMMLDFIASEYHYDMWGRPIEVHVAHTADIVAVSSAGEDGLWGTPDDLISGHAPKVGYYWRRSWPEALLLSVCAAVIALVGIVLVCVAKKKSAGFAVFSVAFILLGISLIFWISSGEKLFFSYTSIYIGSLFLAMIVLRIARGWSVLRR